MRLFLIAILISLNVSAVMAGNVNTIFNPPKADEVFVPPGFDDLDDVQITYVNHSTSSCYMKTYALNPEIDHANKTIKISNMSLVLDSEVCMYRDIPSPSTLNIGELQAGTYKVKFETEDGKFKPYGEINISKSKTEQKDDFEYAPLDINGLTVKVDKVAKNIILNLPGAFPNGCYKFKDVRVIDDRSETVIEVLPIVEAVQTVCTQEIQFFNREVKIPYSVREATKKLIHIRAADGVAINRVVNLE